MKTSLTSQLPVVAHQKQRSTVPATTILIIHHANKNGGFRGTSAIRDAVDETWSLKRPESDPQKRSKEQQQLKPHERLIEVRKAAQDALARI